MPTLSLELLNLLLDIRGLVLHLLDLVAEVVHVVEQRKVLVLGADERLRDVLLLTTEQAKATRSGSFMRE